jgi:hypothetical protein
VQVPVQQSALLAHESPACTQKDDGWQAPLTQSPEQQSVLPPHGLPSVLHPPPPPPSVAHMPLVHVWLQHCPLAAQEVPSGEHAG